MTNPSHAVTNANTTEWEMPFLTLPVHQVVKHQLRLGMSGVESTIVYGPRGAGKTAAIEHYVAALQQHETRTALLAGGQPREILHYESSRANGPKTALVDLYTKLTEQPLGKRSRQDWTPTMFIDQIVRRLVENNTALICIDEAQMIDAANIDQLRQVPDVARRAGRSVRLVLIGNDDLIKQAAQFGHVGERFTGKVMFCPASAAGLKSCWDEMHPDMPRLREQLGGKAWRELEREIVSAMRGSLRRLRAILENAHELSRYAGQPLSEECIRAALAKLA